MKIYIGAMSGTSLDGVDAVAATFESNRFHFLDRASEPFAEGLRNELLRLCSRGYDEIARMQAASNELARIYARVCTRLISNLKEQYPQASIGAIGAHGQTIRHSPEIGASLQMINGALLAELTECDVITDFRSRDLAAGGQGAPLAPAFHESVFSAEKTRCIVNIGGISNITVLPGFGALNGTIGFDCGPGNMLMDAWASKNLAEPFDRNGRWAQSGQIDRDLLKALLADPFFEQAPPKSTGREKFSPSWLLDHLDDQEPEDVQRTLLALTAVGITDAIDRYADETSEVYVCGGGAKNLALMEELRFLNPHRLVATTSAIGLDPMDVEGAAFAWLAYRFKTHRPANLPAVTGAKGPRILGCLYPA